MSCRYPIYTYVWFWLIAIGLLFVTIGFIIWDVRSKLSQTWWVWALLIGGGLLLLVGLIIALWSWYRTEANPTLDGSQMETHPMMDGSQMEDDHVVYNRYIHVEASQ